MSSGLVNVMLESCLTPLHNAVERVPGRPLTPDGLEDVVAAAHVITGLVAAVYQPVMQKLARGWEGREARVELQAGAEVIRRCLEVLGEIRQQVERGGLPPAAQAAHSATLETIARPAEQALTEVTGLLRRLNQPHSTIDLASLPGAEAVPTMEGYVRLEDFIAELEADDPA